MSSLVHPKETGFFKPCAKNKKLQKIHIYTVNDFPYLLKHYQIPNLAHVVFYNNSTQKSYSILSFSSDLNKGSKRTKKKKKIESNHNSKNRKKFLLSCVLSLKILNTIYLIYSTNNSCSKNLKNNHPIKILVLNAIQKPSIFWLHLATRPMKG